MLKVSADEIRLAVTAFDTRFGEMEAVTWFLSKACRPELLEKDSTRSLEALIWLIKSWMGIQGVTHDVRGIAARSLLELPWSGESFGESLSYSVTEEQFACERVETFVTTMKQRGAGRREYSLASKVLHWITPWCVPVYDKYVRDILSVAGRDDESYRKIVEWEFGVSRELIAEGSEWCLGNEPRSPLRILDKYLWWKGGGENGNAVVAKDPWKVIRELGMIPPPDAA